MSKLSPRGRLLLRLLGTGVAIVLVARTLDLPALAGTASSADPALLLLALLVPLAGIALSAQRWRVALELLAIRRPYRELLLRYWGASFYNTVLPGSIGGDVLRIGGLARSGVTLGTSAVSVLADRAVGLWASMLIGLASSMWADALPYRDQLRLLFGGCAAAMLGAALLGGLLARGLLPSLRRGALPARLGAALERAGELVRLLATRQGLLLLVLALLFQSLAVLHLYVAARALQSPISLVASGLYAPALIVITLLPISLSGLGLREATLIVLLGQLGVPEESAALIGLLIYITVVLSSLPGGLRLIWGTPSEQQGQV